MNLFEIDKDLIEYVEKGFSLCVNEDGEINEEQLNKYLVDLPLERERKLEAYGLIIKQLQAESNALKGEIDNLTARKQVKDNKIERLKKAVASSMTAFNENKFETSKVVFSFRKSESVDIDMDLLDKQWVKETVEIKADKTAIKQALKNGEIIKGASLIQKQNLQIK